MKKIVTLYDVSNITKLSEYADGFIVANDMFATRVEKSFSKSDIITAIKTCHDLGKMIFVSINKMLHNDHIEPLKSFINALEAYDPTGYIVGDIGVVHIFNTLKIPNKVIYNPETLLTNKFDFNFNATLGLFGAFLAKEIPLEDVLEITKEKELSVFMYVHGYLNMFYSKRQLINSYFQNSDKPNDYHEKRNLKIREEQRPDLRYPILEDSGGTHVFRENVFTTLNQIDDISTNIDYGIFDMVLHDDDYAYDVLKRYTEIMKGQIENEFDDLEIKYDEQWDEGFLFKKTVYKPKKVTR
ncbi:MAG TPA: U32 family peptidase [Acholeplasma sp.]|nr:U32 family peptidase [Acholeplasma sp.]